MTVNIILAQRLEARDELIYRVDPDLQDHWDSKILGGIVPTEVKHQGLVDMARHNAEMTRLADFETKVIEKLFDGEWNNDKNFIKELHYFGIGTGEALKQVTPIVNEAGHEVVAYDVSSIACENAEEMFEGTCNSVCRADIEDACDKKYINPKKATHLVAPRVLDVLDKQDPDWRKKPVHRRKMARTAKKIGRLLRSSLDVLLVYPLPEDNPLAIWGDGTPHPLEEVVNYMEKGLRAEVGVQILGKTPFHSQTYTAVLIKKHK